ncbi:hypothetical protein [Deinococcus misasensis]|uniref:hypothetical protein n=1 Tax=Deinococcus misasensis TaxID=392413 RepID=UPI00055077AA|nr:hypothetical protein [Deinococcus misasensis]
MSSSTFDAFSSDRFQTMCQMAEVFIRSRMLPPSIQTVEQAIVIMVKGQELGLQPLQALNGINVIQGKPTVSPQTMLSLINRSGKAEDIKFEIGQDFASCTMIRKDRTAHTERFGQKEAQSMGLLNKDNYKRQPLVMYKWRAVAACARIVFPDVIDGLYTPEEMGADVVVDAEGGMQVVFEQQKSEPTISRDAAKRLWDKLCALGFGNPPALASDVLNRPVQSLEELTKSESVEVFEAAQKMAKTAEGAPTPATEKPASNTKLLGAIRGHLTRLGFPHQEDDASRDRRLAFMCFMLGRNFDIKSGKDLSEEEQKALLEKLAKMKDLSGVQQEFDAWLGSDLPL